MDSELKETWKMDREGGRAGGKGADFGGLCPW